MEDCKGVTPDSGVARATHIVRPSIIRDRAVVHKEEVSRGGPVSMLKFRCGATQATPESNASDGANIKEALL